MAKVEIYFKDWCPFCQKALHLLDQKDIEYTEIDVDGKPQLQQEMAQKAGRSSVPQIFIDDNPVGGYDDLAALEASGELDKLLG